ncbi:BTB domain-containing protein [Mycena venus]|uniref:BTB domain-containing protein n=1 Tax=Mycena venus TaxID=2733690 RepID=A0A8H6Z2M7_9AGAR|nr:BTB domain-containing protein [Mycena venus]
MAAVAQNDLQKVGPLWFSPDVVIIRAQTHIFRVFAAILKEKSSVFADMFTFPQPSSGTSDTNVETMEGFPVVALHDDPAEIEVFLKAIFDSEFFMPPPAQCNVEDALGILRLAHKYDVPYLRRRALEHLGLVYPTRLSEFDSRQGNPDAHSFATIVTATEVGALWLLPVPYYNTCRFDLSHLIKSRRWLDLGEEQRATCLIAYAALVQQFPKIYNFLHLSRGQGDDCEDWARCNKVRLDIGFAIIPAFGPFANCPLDSCPEALWSAIKATTCDSCVTESESLHAAAREECWDQLPKMFGLPGWDELEEMRRLALST